MTKLDYKLRPIVMDEWLPDRCMGYGEALNPRTLELAPGCTSLCEFYTKGDRRKLEELYREVLNEYGCCGFVAWVENRIVGYNTFFPRAVADRVRFYGWGTLEDTEPSALVHNCITVRGNPEYRRQGIGSNLMRESLSWGKENGWKRFEAHLVLPDDPSHWADEQKSCRTFWEKLGLQVFRTQDNFERLQSHTAWRGVMIETKQDAAAYLPNWRDKYYCHSMAVDLQHWTA